MAWRARRRVQGHRAGKSKAGSRKASDSPPLAAGHDSVSCQAQRDREAQQHACINMVSFVLTSASAPLFNDLA